MENLIVPELETNDIVSPLGHDLRIQSDSGLNLRGSEGISMEAKSMLWEAGQHVTVASESGSITLDGQVVLDPLGLPVGGGGYQGEKAQYKVCICSPSGKLFTVPAKVANTAAAGRGGGRMSASSCDMVFDDFPHPCEEDQ